MNDIVIKKRCAIYCRKSSVEGLEQDFNSLDAQAEACFSFIASQKAEGWVPGDEIYCDGGYSGGNLDRPGLQRLLDSVRAGQIDCVVVYKIDRLSRSLADFVGLVKIFDAHNVTFISITQSFNTTTSMGRLTLNILLSFGQFERELAGERVRDKICASRKRGIWMGGFPVTGYDVRDRKLVPNLEEAKLVNRIFTRFIALGSVTLLSRELRAEGISTKSWRTLNDKDHVGKLVDRGWLYKMLRNPVYVGIASYKKQHFQGEHVAILDQSIWDRAQEMLSRPEPEKRARQNRPSRAPSLLKGLIWASDGRAMTPTYTIKGNRSYRYYINSAAIKIGPEACEVVRVPAGEVEAVVVDQVRKILQSPEVIAATIREVEKLEPTADVNAAISSLRSIDAIWSELFAHEQARIIQLLVHRVTISAAGIKIDMKADGINDLIESVMSEPELSKAA
jgi:site-specific DNA recombinase